MSTCFAPMSSLWGTPVSSHILPTHSAHCTAASPPALVLLVLLLALALAELPLLVLELELVLLGPHVLAPAPPSPGAVK